MRIFLDRSGQLAQQNDDILRHMVSFATTSLPRLQSNDSQKFSFLLQTVVNAVRLFFTISQFEAKQGLFHSFNSHSKYNGSLTHYTKSFLLLQYLMGPA